MTCPTCGFEFRAGGGCGWCAIRRDREAANAAGLVEHLSRAPLAYSNDGWALWRDWFTWRLVDVDAEDRPVYEPREFLGQRSGRTGPDPVDAKQRCGCFQCTGEDS